LAASSGQSDVLPVTVTNDALEEPQPQGAQTGMSAQAKAQEALTVSSMDVDEAPGGAEDTPPGSSAIGASQKVEEDKPDEEGGPPP
jgi:hypothetical protein